MSPSEWLLRSGLPIIVSPDITYVPIRIPPLSPSEWPLRPDHPIAVFPDSMCVPIKIPP